MKHPAKFTDDILYTGRSLLDMTGLLYLIGHVPVRVLDPFAGTGKGVDYMRRCGYDAVGVELEPEWAALSPHVVVGDALHLPFADGTFDAVFTSPAYGNRMADVDMRESCAGTYAKSLGRRASEGSSCHLQWGKAYKDFHRAAWREAARVLKPGGFVLLNVKDHIRGGQLQLVPDWHLERFLDMGFAFVEHRAVKCPGLKKGTNADLRVDHECLFLFRKPSVEMLADRARAQYAEALDALADL